MWVREFYPDVRPLLHYFLAALRLRPKPRIWNSSGRVRRHPGPT